MSQMNDSLIREIKLSKQNGRPTHQLLQLFEEIARTTYNRRYSHGVKNTDLEQTMLKDTFDQLKKSYVKFKPEKCENAHAYLTSCAVGPMIRAITKHKQQANATRRGIWG